ncbi:hypothetical protein [uncultured Cloacibacillus sp.]|uniref:hypothetical protein n=1 Tax=uncultured Cloacibacillus sp. TaxID=889794 RepID=UPI00320AC181
MCQSSTRTSAPPALATKSTMKSAPLSATAGAISAMGFSRAARRLAVDGGDDVGTELRELRAQRLRAHERAVGRFEVFGARAYRLGHLAEAVAEYAVRDGEDFIAGLYDALHRAP